MKKGLFIAAFFLWSAMIPALPQEAAAAKARAYELYQAKRFNEAAQQFKAYFDTNPNDPTAMIDYASLLSELARHEEAAKLLETVHQNAPENETASFKLAVEYAALKRYADAEKIFAELEKSNNPAIASAAADSSKKANEDQRREARFKAEQHVYDLANQFNYQDVINAVGELEKEPEPLSFTLQMQRLYALQSLHQYAMALDRANQLEAANPNQPDLALLRAELLVQLGRRPEAEALWREVKQKFQGTPAAAQASQRLAAPASGSLAASPEDHIYDLARQRKHREVIAAIGELEKKRPLSLQMQMQRLYAYQSLGEGQRALQQIDQIAAAHSNSTELAFMKSDLLVQQHRWQEGSAILKRIKDEQGSTKIAVEAERRLQAIPAIANLDKNYWGEAYVSGDYLGRFGTVVGSGFVRQGAFVPSARWLQPYAELRFGADTRSGIAERTIITDNHIGFYGGVRAQPLPAEYLFVYAQAGGDTDLLDRRHNGDFSFDYQAGIYAFKSWGPGTVLFRAPPGWKPPTDRADSFAAETSWHDTTLQDLFFWRGDWFTDVGADFSYYHRYASWIGYGQAHEGFRLFQFGPNAGFDAYAVENLSWDVRGNYFDNLIELGPGTRWLWRPHRGWEVILRTEWLNGFYFGRGRDAFAVAPRSHYDEIRAALSVGARW